MTTLKLSYFDFDGGRGETARLAFRLGNIDFEDHRIPIADWPTSKTQYPFHQVPVLEVDGCVLTQSNAINRYIGKLTGLYPGDNWQAALCDEAMDAVEDAAQLVVNTFFMEEDEKQRIRSELVLGPLPLYLSVLNEKLIANGGNYFADNRLTIADLKVYTWGQMLMKGHLDYIPTSMVADYAPVLLEHKNRIEALLAL